MARDRLTEPAYACPSRAGHPLDILYGHGESFAQGNLFMAHCYGFTQKTLVTSLHAAGFGTVARMRCIRSHLNLWVLARKGGVDEAGREALTADHFPR